MDVEERPRKGSWCGMKAQKRREPVLYTAGHEPLITSPVTSQRSLISLPYYARARGPPTRYPYSYLHTTTPQRLSHFDSGAQLDRRVPQPMTRPTRRHVVFSTLLHSLIISGITSDTTFLWICPLLGTVDCAAFLRQSSMLSLGAP